MSRLVVLMIDRRPVLRFLTIKATTLVRYSRLEFKSKQKAARSVEFIKL